MIRKEAPGMAKLFSQRLSLLLANFSIVTRPRDRILSESADIDGASSDPREASRGRRGTLRRWCHPLAMLTRTPSLATLPSSPSPGPTGPSLLHLEPGPRLILYAALQWSQDQDSSCMLLCKSRRPDKETVEEGVFPCTLESQNLAQVWPLTGKSANE